MVEEVNEYAQGKEGHRGEPPQKSMNRQGRATMTVDGWLMKALAGAIPGFFLSVALTGWVAALLPGGLPEIQNEKSQFVMWMLAPLWLAILSASFLFRTPLQAWVWLSLANLIAFGSVEIARSIQGGA